MGTKVNSNYDDLLTFTRASKGHALRPVSYGDQEVTNGTYDTCLLYTSPSPRDGLLSRMPSSA